MTRPAWLDSEDDDEFRSGLQDFFRSEGPGKSPKDPAERLQWRKDWCAKAFDTGVSGPSWPREVGGMDLSFSRQVIYSEEAAKARIPTQPGTGVIVAGPTVITHGTEEQKRQWLPGMLRADLIWAQGFSEPGAGSDLPALSTTAVRDGDEYVVNGQKVWSTEADVADKLYALVRTGPRDSRQRGITYLVLDLHAPGVTVQPLRDLTGRSDFCEIFLDDVRAPVSDRVGDENDGWRLARTSLGHERAAGAMTQAGFYARVFAELVDLAKKRGATDDPLWRQRLTELDGRIRIMGLNARTIVDAIETTGRPGPVASVSRLFNSLLEQQLHELAVDMLGPFGLLTRDDEDTVQRGRWVQGFLRTRASTIGAGTAEIQRNTIAEQVLDLPRDPAMPTQ